MTLRRLNWPLWAGFLLTLVSAFTFVGIFVEIPATRNFPWVTLLLFLLAAVLLVLGLRRGFAADQAKPLRAKIGVVVLTGICALMIATFVFGYFVAARWLPASTGAPQVGQKAPEFTLADTSGKTVALAELLATPINGSPAKGMLLIFYRGYWCIMCNSELRGLQKSLPEFNAQGIHTVAISVDNPEVSRNLAQQQGYTFTILSDPNVEAIRRYDLVHAGAGESGHDIARPAGFLIDSSGTVRWANLTENYWVRPRPEQILEAAKLLK